MRTVYFCSHLYVRKRKPLKLFARNVQSAKICVSKVCSKNEFVRILCLFLTKKR